MYFTPGRPLAVMCLCCCVSGLAILFQHPARRADLTLWVSAETHARMYRDGPGSLLDQFHARSGKTAALDLIAPAALDVRLQSLFMFAQGRQSGADPSAPDLVEVDIGSIGKFFRPPASEIGFLPMNAYLARSGWMRRILAARFSPWTRSGVIFGVPDDLHPCTLTYRRDLFDQAGVDLAAANTWPELQRLCLKFQSYWSKRGQPRWALGLSSTAPDMLLVMLHQQHIDLVDGTLQPHLTDERVVQTLCWYAQAVAGTDRIATDVSPGVGQSARELASGEICGLITPDWMVPELKQYGPDLAGKLAMSPLPRFSPNDARTASWGGTMIGITRTCADPDSAWMLIESLYLDRAALTARQKWTGILPPIPEYWSDRVYHERDPFYADQKVDELFIELARELPEARMTPYTVAAQTYLAIALNRAVAKVRYTGSSGLEPACRQWLNDSQSRIEAMVEFDKSGS
jgi:ABC-type glycerol-3-phosphate transport system substrate-binding protein